VPAVEPIFWPKLLAANVSLSPTFIPDSFSMFFLINGFAVWNEVVEGKKKKCHRCVWWSSMHFFWLDDWRFLQKRK
jgi:hypothetical protein